MIVNKTNSAQTAQNKTQKINFKDIEVDENKQFRATGYQIADDPKAIDKLERSIKAFGLKNPPTVESIGNGKFSLVDGFHRVAAWKRLWKQAGVNKSTNPYRQIDVKVKTFANDCDRDTYKFEANRHEHGYCSPNTSTDIESYLIRQARDPKGCFHIVVPNCATSSIAFVGDLTNWLLNEAPEFTKRERDKMHANVLSHMGIKTTPPKFRTWLKDDAIEAMKVHFAKDWNGLKSMDLSNDKKVLCGTVSSNEHHAKPGVALNKLISELGTRDWTQVTLPIVRLVGYVQNVTSSMTEDGLDKKRLQIQASIKRMNEFCKNNVAGVKGNLIEYYELPQKVGVETGINKVL